MKHNRDKRNELRLVSLLPLHVGIIDLHHPEQDIPGMKEYFRELGVQKIGVDAVRSVGRGRDIAAPITSPEETLCGACIQGKAAITPYGMVFPCVFSRWVNLGNVHDHSRNNILCCQETQHIKYQL